MKAHYLGEDTPELRAWLAFATTLKAEAADRKKSMTRLARTLRAEGLITTDRDTGSLLLAFARAGVFRIGKTLIGRPPTASMRVNSVLGLTLMNWRKLATSILPASSGFPWRLAIGSKKTQVTSPNP